MQWRQLRALVFGCMCMSRSIALMCSYAADIKACACQYILMLAQTWLVSSSVTFMPAVRRTRPACGARRKPLHAQQDVPGRNPHVACRSPMSACCLLACRSGTRDGPVSGVVYMKINHSTLARFVVLCTAYCCHSYSNLYRCTAMIANISTRRLGGHALRGEPGRNVRQAARAGPQGAC